MALGIVDLFEALVRELGLARGEEGECFGLTGDHPVILSPLGADPPAIMFKIRVNSEDGHDIELPETFSEWQQRAASEKLSP